MVITFGVLSFVCVDVSCAFGRTGHRVIGRIAERHLTPAAKRAVQALLGRVNLAQVSTYPDEIRSDPRFSHAAPWHYVNIEDGKTYETSKKNPQGDAVEAMARFTATLRSPSASNERKIEALKWIVHLVGDIHQPLHVGRSKDRGGNAIDAMWFGDKTNLHTVWDSKMIDSTQLGFSELADFIDTATDKQVAMWQSSTVLEWVRESFDHRERAYTVPDPTTRGSYRYSYKHLPLVKLRLSQAGVRLAGLLNEIFAATHGE